MSIPHITGITDEELMIYAMREAQLVLAQHIARSPRDAEETIALLLEILDRPVELEPGDRRCHGGPRGVDRRRQGHRPPVPELWTKADKLDLP